METNEKMAAFHSRSVALTAPSALELKENLRASSVRVALGIFSVGAVVLFWPSLLSLLWVPLAYVASAIGFHVAIRHDVGGSFRIVLGGLVDVAFVTFLVHQLGSHSTPLVAAYVLLGVFNALVAPTWAARVLGVVSASAYAAVTVAEATGALPYAPHVPAFGPAPSLHSAFHDSVYVAVLVLAATWVSERIARSLRLREQLLRDANAGLEELSLRDPLTRLYNRRHLESRLDEELPRVRRGHPAALLMLDLDRFKSVNDEHGHLAGDEMLRRLAAAIEETTRAIDVVGRFGGDEFVALLPDTDAEQAAVVADRLVRTVRFIGEKLNPVRPVTVSVGIAVAQPDDDVATWLNSADDAAYRAKSAGGDRYALAHPALRHSTRFDSGFRTARAG
jgi:diguanylate cyclase (GGDEF)-like protein